MSGTDKKFYFTYGSEGQPFPGGWTLIHAPDRKTAEQIFKAFHECRIRDLLNCCCVYDEDEFKKTKAWTKGNLGHRCWEEISFVRKFRDFDDE